MSVESTLNTLLKTLGYPVNSIVNNSENLPDTYITWMLYDNQGSLYGDDVELETEHYFLINIYSKTNLLQISRNMETMLKNSNFYKKGKVDLPYDKENKLFGRAERYLYIEEV